jgi:hypothetical protein
MIPSTRFNSFETALRSMHGADASKLFLFQLERRRRAHYQAQQPLPDRHLSYCFPFKDILKARQGVA